MASGGRVAYLPVDIDSQYGRSNLPDHGDLLKNIILWAAKDTLPIYISGVGLINAQLYSQPGRLILLLVNLTSQNTWQQPLDELIRARPFSVRVKLQDGVTGHNVKALVSPASIPPQTREGWCRFEINQ